MRTSVALEYRRAKGDLTEVDAISGAKAHSGRPPPSPACLWVAGSTCATATSTAAGAKGSLSRWRFARITSRTSLLTVELSGARAAV